MNSFELAKAYTTSQVRELLGDKPDSIIKAGGIDVLDRLKQHLIAPPRLVDIKSLDGLDEIGVEGDGTLRIGALVTLAKVAAHDDIKERFPALAHACGEAASPQIRNVATIGGNLLQRPRCWYFRLESYPCIKKGGDICFAIAGMNRYHVIFGGGPAYPPHPSSAAIPLVAYNATFVIDGQEGTRTVPAEDFFTLPADDPLRENSLGAGEILTEIRVPSPAGTKSAYAEVRERAGFDWPLASTAIVVKTEDGLVTDARVVLGHVATIPWLSVSAHDALVGQPVGPESAAAAGLAAVEGAEPMTQNAYKIDLISALVRRVVASLA
jgi:xanthine dehydrogenase YagS FAD-binding subunit